MVTVGKKHLIYLCPVARIYPENFVFVQSRPPLYAANIMYHTRNAIDQRNKWYFAFPHAFFLLVLLWRRYLLSTRNTYAVISTRNTSHTDSFQKTGSKRTRRLCCHRLLARNEPRRPRATLFSDGIEEVFDDAVITAAPLFREATSVELRPNIVIVNEPGWMFDMEYANGLPAYPCTNLRFRLLATYWVDERLAGAPDGVRMFTVNRYVPFPCKIGFEKDILSIIDEFCF